MKDNTAVARRNTKISRTIRNANLSPDGKWRSFPKVPHLLQYVSTGTYYGRVKVNGKVYRQSLETHVYSTALIKLPDFLKEQRDKRVVDGNPTRFADAQKLYEIDLASDHSMSDSSKRYRRYCIKKINNSWPDLSGMKLNKISTAECKSWAGRLAENVDEQYFNNVLGTMRSILKRAGVSDRYDPTTDLKRLSVAVPDVKLPTLEQFNQILAEMETSGAGQQQACADFARFLAYSGCRLSEARRVTWADVDLTGDTIMVRSAKVRRARTKAKPTRTIPIIKPMRRLLDRLATEPHDVTDCVCKVGECEKSLIRACRIVGVQKLTHHKLRDLFATICIESGVDIPTVADWLGHCDGGKLLLERYRKHRVEHSRAAAKKVTFEVSAEPKRRVKGCAAKSH